MKRDLRISGTGIGAGSFFSAGAGLGAGVLGAEAAAAAAPLLGAAGAGAPRADPQVRHVSPRDTATHRIRAAAGIFRDSSCRGRRDTCSMKQSRPRMGRKS